MASCPDCSSVVPDGSRFCPTCGAPTDPDATRLKTADVSANAATSAPRPNATPSRTPIGRPTGSHDQSGVYIAGTVLADRYRIIGQLGKGGMGEVYRADDLKLGQPVALKFLPRDLSDDASRLALLMDEVRAARQVAHPNVCRVYDAGEAGGRQFLTMEYIDGEDLATSLRRIGRFPVDKGLEIARQLCAGLAAVHERGLLHRDLKPANVMLDGRGKVRLTDFGLASEAAGPGGAGETAGTPAYMAPELLSGKTATVQSDVYALGLVLYEVFSGRRAFDATSIAGLRQQQESVGLHSLSSATGAIDPAIEEVVLCCLNSNPAARPTSAILVAARLPGGDPLAAALAAGQTPSPAMVAAAGEGGGLQPRVAMACLVGFFVLLAAVVGLIGQYGFTRFVPLDYPPDVLANKAQEMLGRLWPHTIISWSRMLSGRLRDPLVGRDLLVGSLCGVLFGLIQWTAFAGRGYFGIDPAPIRPALGPLLGSRFLASAAITFLYSAILNALGLFVLVFLLRLALRRDWLAGGALIVISTAASMVGKDLPLFTAAFNIAALLVFVTVLLRFGLVAVSVANFIAATFSTGFPITMQFSRWYGGGTVVVLLALSAVAVYGFRLSQGGRMSAGVGAAAGAR